MGGSSYLIHYRMEAFVREYRMGSVCVSISVVHLKLFKYF